MPLIDPIRMLRKKRVLVTGGSGFLGAHLVPELRKVCGAVALYNKDVRSIDRYAKKFDIVCHLAGIGKVPDNGSIETMFDVNCCGTLAVLNYCRRTGAACVFASSAAVYTPSGRRRLLDEDAPTGPVLTYGASKLLAEKICRHQARNFYIDVTVLRIFNPYGPGQREPYFIPYVVKALRNDKRIVLKTPDVVRDFIHVSDVAKAFVAACAKPKAGFRVYNVGTGEGVRVRDVVRLASRFFGSKPRIAEDPLMAALRNYVIADTGKIFMDLGWRSSVAFEDGLRSVIESAE